MKTKKIYASIIAALSAFTCLASLSTNGLSTHNYSVRYSKDKTFMDRDGKNYNYCTYKTKIEGYFNPCYSFKASMDSAVGKNIYPDCTISAKKRSGGWKYFAESRREGACGMSSYKAMTEGWSYTPLYTMIDFETSALCSRLNITY